MRYKITCFIITLVLIAYSVPIFAQEVYDYEFSESHCGSEEYEESRKIDATTYFKGMSFYDNIQQIAISYILVGGNEGRGSVLKYNFLTDEHSSSIYLVPPNPGDDPLGEYKVTGVIGSIFSLLASEGEIFFKEIAGIINYGEGYKNFIIRFPGSGSDPDPDPVPDPDPEKNPPGRVQNIQVDSKGGDIIVRWDPLPNADGYKVHINGKETDVGNTNKHVFPAGEGQYDIDVTGYNKHGESPKGTPITVIRPPDNPIIIINPPAIGDSPIPIYFPNPPSPPSAPSITPLPNGGSYVPKPDDFNLNPSMPDYNPNHYNPDRDGSIFEYTPPPLDIPEPIGTPEPLPSIPDPVIVPHDDPKQKDPPKGIENPKTSQEPLNPQEPNTPEPPRQTDPVTMDPPRTMDPVKIDPPRERDPVRVDPPREMDPVKVDPPRPMDPVRMDPPRPRTGYTPEPPRKIDPPR